MADKTWVLCLLPGLWGCIVPVDVRLPVEGTVVDGATSLPIAGATIEIDTWVVSQPDLKPIEKLDTYTVTSDENGGFSVALVSDWEWGIPFLPHAIPLSLAQVSVSASGYEPTEYTGWEADERPAPIPAGPWVLTPSTAAP